MMRALVMLFLFLPMFLAAQQLERSSESALPKGAVYCSYINFISADTTVPSFVVCDAIEDGSKRDSLAQSWSWLHKIQQKSIHLISIDPSCPLNSSLWTNYTTVSRGQFILANLGMDEKVPLGKSKQVLLVNPKGNHLEFDTACSVGVLFYPKQRPDTLIESLIRDGNWVKTFELKSGLDARDSSNLEVFRRASLWLDSLFTEGVAISGQSTKTGITTTLPEVVRQGTVIEFDLFVAKAGDFKLSLNDLSAKAQYEQTKLLGLGRQRIRIPTRKLEWGVYNLVVDGPGVIIKHKIIVRG